MSLRRSDARQLSPNLWEIPAREGMRVPARFYANERLLDAVFADNALQQLVNVAHLPGVTGSALAMPDIHWGYGFPIGGVAAMDVSGGVISPGGVGYDINCGVRFIRTDLTGLDADQALEGLFRDIPTGVGSHGAIPRIDRRAMIDLLTRGARWAIDRGYGTENDLDAIEDGGCLPGADPAKISDRAFKRGDNQAGTLGSGNHFIEIARVTDIYDPGVASALRIEQGQIAVLVHTGSRGFGHQVCDDYLNEMLHKGGVPGFTPPDRQLVSAAIDSPLGRDYLSAMACAANFAWVNRQIITELVKRSLRHTLGRDDFAFELVYDVCHNIAKIEKHTVDGREATFCVHRKGATRAFAPGRPELSARFRDLGQPVIIPGDMGTESFLCIGTDRAMRETFGSSCHGAGRRMSRNQALRNATPEKVLNAMRAMGIKVRAAQKDTLVEEMSDAYKDVGDVVQTMHDSGITRKVLRTVPIAVLKG